MKKRETVEYWSRQIKSAETNREGIARQYEWKKLKDLWNNGGQEVQVNTSSNLQTVSVPTRSAFVNWVFSYISTFIPAVYWRHPRVFVEPKKYLFAQAAKIAESKLNAVLEMTNFRKQAVKCLLDDLIFGIGWMKLGWFTQYGQVPEGPTVASEDSPQSKIDNETWFYQDEAYAYRVSPERILVDPEADTYEEMRWIAQEHYRLYDLVEKDPYLKGTNIKNALKFSLPGSDAVIASKRDESEWVRIWEVWDKEEGKVLFNVDGCEKISRTVDWPYRFNDFPFEPLMLSDAIDTFYPPSLILPWLPLVEELACIRSIRLDHLSRMVTKYLVQENAFTREQLEAFLDPDQEVIEASNIEALRELQGLKPAPELYKSEEGIKEDIREISGFSELLSGSVPYSRMSATTSSLMQKNSALRFNFASERTGEFIKSCAKKLLLITTEYQQYPDTIRMSTNPTEPPIQYEKREIDGEFLFTIHVDDMSFTSREQKIKEQYDALVAHAQFPQVKVHSLIRDSLIAWGKDPIEDYLNPEQGPPIDPSFENEMMLRGVPAEPNPQEDMQTHLAVHQQFMQMPTFMQAVRAMPQIAALFNEHLQKTLNMYDAMMQQAPQGRAMPGTSPSLQSGTANATSRPVGGAKNMKGPMGNALMQSMGREIQ